MKKKTHEDYIIELSIKNPTVEVVEKYVNAQTAILHHCLLHDVYWKVLPGNALAGKGCKECMKEKNRNKFIKSHNTYISQLKEINPNIIVLEQYIDSNTPILHLCKTHNIKWKVTPSNILRGQGCKECGKDKNHDKKCKNHDDYIKELLINHPTVEIIDKYIDSKTPVLHHCLLHDEYWNIAPSNVLHGHGCSKCRKEKVRNIMVKSHKDYTKALFEKNQNVKVVGKYIDCKTKIIHRCLIHDEYWDITPSNALKGCGCKKCLSERISQENALTNEEYIQILHKKNPTTIALEEYVNMKTQIWHQCIIHNYKWKVTPGSVLQGCGCPECKKEKISALFLKIHEQYVEELKETNPDIIVLDNYIDTNTPILHKCLIDNNEWYVSPCNILSGTGCPQCNETKGERLIRRWLKNNCIMYEFQKTFDNCKDIRLLQFDFYLPEYNLCIEYDGKQHFEPIEHFGGQEYFEYIRKHDQIKNEFCKHNGISLLRIPYFNNIEEELNNFLFI